jgi:hypothetical protein
MLYATRTVVQSCCLVAVHYQLPSLHSLRPAALPASAGPAV